MSEVLFIVWWPNYAFNPIAEQALRTNQTMPPARLIAALGFRPKECGMRDAIVRFLIATSVLTAASMVVFWTGFLWNHTKTQGGIMVGFGVESGCRELPQGTVFEPVMSVQRRLEIIVRAKIAHRCDARLEGTAEERNGEIFLIATDPTGRPLDSKGLGGCMCEKTLVYRLKAAGIRKPGSFSLVFGERVVGRVKEG